MCVPLAVLVHVHALYTCRSYELEFYRRLLHVRLLPVYMYMTYKSSYTYMYVGACILIGTTGSGTAEPFYVYFMRLYYLYHSRSLHTCTCTSTGKTKTFYRYSYAVPVRLYMKE